MAWIPKGCIGSGNSSLCPGLHMVAMCGVLPSQKSVEILALCYYAPMWKTTPTASLQLILNKKPSHLEVMNVGIRSYICIKKLFQNNFWDGKTNNKRVHGHFATLKQSTHKIIP